MKLDDLIVHLQGVRDEQDAGNFDVKMEGLLALYDFDCLDVIEEWVCLKQDK